MRDACDAMSGNATADSSVMDLKSVMNDCDALIDNSTVEVTAIAHEYCEKVSGFLLGDFAYTPTGRGTQVDITELISEGNQILNP